MKIVVPITINDAALISTNVSETLHPPYDAGYVYALGDRVSIIGSDIHEVYESLVASNVGNDPAASTTKWVYVSATNPWLMFDKSVTSQTENADSIDVSLQATGRISALALLNVSAVEARVVMIDPLDGVVYDETHSLVSNSGIDSWYDYFFEPIVRLNDLVITGLPLYSGPIINITLSAPGETVKCGALVIGPTTDVGETQYSAAVGIQDFSTKDQDTFGNYSIVQRAYRKRATFPVIIDSARVDTLHNFLASLRATPTLYIGADDYTSTAIYGFFKDFTIEIVYAKESLCSLEIEGLT
ncbi:hypothetical protein C8R31_101671 [Nitrosospira sp. Nsp2]|uniref:hypothetical protein n=1 Tax=Nitrosospira sp. Nsp2 TaxID=136548 RepID=UPI000D3031F9|nr:hypothetical protein [Nitrosospira sp. Nsp2]PTR17507.1 hypothetical protein C8R31_101671 [Nitrosospira sp. Nsp2]